MVKTIEINAAYTPYLDNQDRYLVFYGGAGSGKSVFASQKVILRITSGENHKFLIVRKVGKTIKESVFSQLKQTIREFGQSDHFKVNNTEKTFTHDNGNEIICIGIDDQEKMKSIVGVTSIWIEEPTELTEDDFDQLDLRLRGETDSYKQIMLTFNPIDERHWLYNRFFDRDHEKTSILKTTYEDNYFLDDEYKKVLDLKAQVNPNYYRIYKLGQWGRPEVNRAYAYNFNYDRHTKPAVLRKDQMIRLSFDFNVSPFVCLVLQIWRDKDGHHIQFLEEITLDPGDVLSMCEHIKSKFTAVQISTMLVTGDAMQKKREITQRNNIDAWKIIKRELNMNDRRLQVPRSNPKVSENRHLLNSLLALHPDLTFDPGMKLTIDELQFTESDEDGNILKKDRNKMSQRADALDAVRYALNTWMNDFIDRPNKYI